MIYEVTLTRIRTISEIATVEVDAEDEDTAGDEALALVAEDDWCDQSTECEEPEILNIEPIGEEDDCDDAAGSPTVPLSHLG